MIVVDASALLALLLGEPDAETYFEALSRDEAILSPVGYWEVAVRVRRLKGEQGLHEFDQLLEDFGISVRPSDLATATLAAEAEARYGKHTPAGLNLGDCFAYALAQEAGAALLYKGDDFARTDVEPALPRRTPSPSA